MSEGFCGAGQLTACSCEPTAGAGGDRSQCETPITQLVITCLLKDGFNVLFLE